MAAPIRIFGTNSSPNFKMNLFRQERQESIRSIFFEEWTLKNSSNNPKKQNLPYNNPDVKSEEEDLLLAEKLLEWLRQNCKNDFDFYPTAVATLD